MSVAARSYATRDWRAVGAALAMLGVCAGIAFIGGLSFLCFWLIGGRFTIDGTAGIATLLAQFIGAPWRIAPPLPWQPYVAALPIPLAASAAEFGVPTVLAVFRPPRGRRDGRRLVDRQRPRSRDDVSRHRQRRRTVALASAVSKRSALRQTSAAPATVTPAPVPLRRRALGVAEHRYRIERLAAKRRGDGNRDGRARD